MDEYSRVQHLIHTYLSVHMTAQSMRVLLQHDFMLYTTLIIQLCINLLSHPNPFSPSFSIDSILYSLLHKLIRQSRHSRRTESSFETV